MPALCSWTRNVAPPPRSPPAPPPHCSPIKPQGLTATSTSPPSLRARPGIPHAQGLVAGAHVARHHQGRHAGDRLLANQHTRPVWTRTHRRHVSRRKRERACSAIRADWDGVGNAAFTEETPGRRSSGAGGSTVSTLHVSDTLSPHEPEGCRGSGPPRCQPCLHCGNSPCSPGGPVGCPPDTVGTDRHPGTSRDVRRVGRLSPQQEPAQGPDGLRGDLGRVRRGGHLDHRPSVFLEAEAGGPCSPVTVT